MARSRSKTALVLAGGGIMGAAYEIGCLSALEKVFRPGFSVRRFDIYLGISAGSVIATLMANRISPAEMFRVIARDERKVFNFRRADIYCVDYLEMLKSTLAVGRNLWRIFRSYRGQGGRLFSADLFHILQEQFPSGLFSLAPMQDYMCRSFRQEGVLDNFNLIKPELYIPAIDLDRGERVVFGSEGWRDLHVCRAITASCAIPAFFRPYRISGHHYIDGSIGQVAHLDVPIERGAELIVVINPLVPIANDPEHTCLPSLSYGQCTTIAELGISYVWDQAQRIENRYKLDLAIERLRRDHPGVDIILFEPGPADSLFFLQNPMSFEARVHVMNYGYHLTLGQLKENYADYQSLFARHGIQLDAAQLDAPPPAEVTV